MNFKTSRSATLGILTLLAACSSAPKKVEPSWIHQSTRNVDNGYIVYIGQSESLTLERTQFQAEGLALEDLANECSLIPKGTRIEDRFTDKAPNGYIAYVKVAVEMQECERAAKSVEPTEIKKIANLPFTEQLKKYQDLLETGDNSEVLASNQSAAEVEPATEIGPAPPQGNMNESVHFYVTRQYVAYQKEIVVLSPQTAYQPQSAESRAFTSAVTPVQTQLQTIAATQPTLKTNPQPWSVISGPSNSSVHIGRPANLKPPVRASQHDTPHTLRPGGAMNRQGFKPVRANAFPQSRVAQPKPGPASGRRRKKRN